MCSYGGPTCWVDVICMYCLHTVQINALLPAHKAVLHHCCKHTACLPALCLVLLLLWVVVTVLLRIFGAHLAVLEHAAQQRCCIQRTSTACLVLHQWLGLTVEAAGCWKEQMGLCLILAWLRSSVVKLTWPYFES